MHRRIWHRDDRCIVVSVKPFVEEIYGVLQCAFPTPVVGGETFFDALIVSPTLFLDMVACVSCDLLPPV